MHDVAPLRSPFHDEMLSLYRHRWWILSPLIICLLLAAAYNRVARSVYVSEAVVSVDLVNRLPVLSAGAQENAITKQISLISSLELAEEIVDAPRDASISAELSTGPVRTGLDVVRGVYQDVVSPAPGRATKTQAIEGFLSRIQISRSPPSPWIRIQFSSHEPAAGAAALNQLLDVYLRKVKKENEASSQSDRDLLAQTLGNQKAEVGETLGLLSDKSRQTQGGNPAYQRPMMQRQLGALQDQYASVTARLVTLAAQVAQSTRGAPDLGVAGAETPRSQALKIKLDELKGELAAKQESLGEKHPEVRAIVSQIKSAEDGLRNEVAAARAGLERELALLSRQQVELRAALDRGVREASDVAVSSFDAAILMREADAGERALSEACLLYTSPSPRDRTRSRMPSSA